MSAPLSDGQPDLCHSLTCEEGPHGPAQPQPARLQGKGILSDLVWKGPSGSSASLVPVLSSRGRSPPPISLRDWSTSSSPSCPRFPPLAVIPSSSFHPIPMLDHSCYGFLAMSPACPPPCSSKHLGAGRGALKCSTGSHHKREMIPCGFSGRPVALS